jgi:hypothetical protein
MNDAECNPEQAENGTLDIPEGPLTEPVSGTPEPDEQKKALAELNDRFLRILKISDDAHQRNVKL